uniref:DUF4216 domain-containing protein n=1 Tax=Setaria viridis TaxID=4556 RepID=A0A4U6UXK3_SETVI|nr:hypothetical protein SEVIR_4G163000v2 [Setaria viridis]
MACAAWHRREFCPLSCPTCFINGFMFKTAHVEKNLTTQNSGVVVNGDPTTGNIDLYGVVKKIYALDFQTQKEVILFQCDWYDVPAASRSKGSKKQDWSTVIRMNPRNVFFMPELDNSEEIDVDSIDVGFGDMIETGTHEDLTNWTRTSVEGVTGDASVIEKALVESIPKPTTIDLENEDEVDDTDDYIDDGYIVPVNSTVDGAEDVFFV